MLRNAVPTPAANHATRAPAPLRPRRIRYRITRIISPKIQTPFPNIAMHVLQAPSIRRIRANITSLPIVIAKVCLFSGQRISKMICRRRSCPTSIFPLCLRRQGKLKKTRRGNIQGIQFRDVFLATIPRNSPTSTELPPFRASKSHGITLLCEGFRCKGFRRFVCQAPLADCPS